MGEMGEMGSRGDAPCTDAEDAQVSRPGDLQCSVGRLADRSAVFVEVPVALFGPGLRQVMANT